MSFRCAKIVAEPILVHFVYILAHITSPLHNFAKFLVPHTNAFSIVQDLGRSVILPLQVTVCPVSSGCSGEYDGTNNLVVSGFTTCIGVTVEISLYRRCRNLFYIDVIGGAHTKTLHRDTSRDDCRTSFLIYTSRDDRDISRDDCILPFLRNATRDDSRNLLCRDTNRNGRRVPFLRDTGRYNSRYTIVEVPL